MAVDPLAEIVTLLQPAARFSKLVECAGSWRIHREATGEPFYCAILEGTCRVKFGSHPPFVLQAGDFVLAPAMRDLVNESIDAPADLSTMIPTQVRDGHFRVGRHNGPADLRMRIGHCSFGAPDTALLVSLLPDVVLVRGEPRLATLMQLVGEETRERRPARELVLERLLEVLLIEALRSGTETTAAPGLSRGLADERLAAALHALHARPEHPWTVSDLAAEAALSRSAFFARFSRIVGLPPMEYLLAWRMALAKQLLRSRELGMDQVAERVGYGSASAFSVAFARYAGMPPARYARSIPSSD
ncbi:MULTISPECIES: AraC family transcriptional regulator [unclassified Sinorhizobium]|uniref:AraC family transcriptional regulator n=1 Tax=unclassified Sinorhizobium TaxID=2613772 RepID=UPI0024C22B54|nr:MULTISPECIES: AraC family transcriptional regulator [unclassified Sinorhizobium]MDK1373495.1 AraC family transcriptional regulator [Sinorhizobium sp. 6-70]MDK1479730.1 AraC family transcriptional regulator [Sinorhizobium sp. 6-117]